MHVFSCFPIVHFIVTLFNKCFNKLNIFSCISHLFVHVYCFRTDVNNNTFFFSNCETTSHLSENACFVSQVRTTRNSVMHNPDFTFTTAEMKTHLHRVTDLLREPNLHVQSLGTTAKDAIDGIYQVRQWAD